MPVLNSVSRVYVGTLLASAVYLGSNIVWQPSGAFDFYVDSVNGSDSNNGKSEATAFKSISSIPMANGITIGLKAGSYWRETLDASGFNNVDVNMYGEGKLPVLDAADVISTTWINDSGNIWYTDVVTADDQYTMYNSLWKDGVRMEWFANTTLLTTNNDYYVAEAPALNTYNARFYIYSDTDPNTSGALYEYASRHYGAVISTGGVLRRVRTKRQLHNNGSTVIGDEGQAQYCIFEDGVKHNVYIGRNSSAFQCIAYKHDTPKRTNSTLYVGHTQNGVGYNVGFYNCLAIAEPTKTAWANINSAGVTGFYAHTSGPTGKWDEVRVFDCTAANCNEGISGTDAKVISTGNSWAHNCYSALGALSDQLYAADLKVTDQTHSVIRGVVLNNVENAVVQRMRMYLTRPTNQAMIYDFSQSGTCIIQNSVLMLANGSPAGYNYFYRFLNENRGIQLQNNIMYTYDRDCGGISTPNSATNMWTPQNYWGGTDNYDYTIAGVTRANFPAAQADANFGYLFADNICVDYGPSCVVDPANGNFATVAGSDAATLNAGIGATDDVTYTAIPTYAEIDLM